MAEVRDLRCVECGQVAGFDHNAALHRTRVRAARDKVAADLERELMTGRKPQNEWDEC